jgi:hypothetical protein
VGRRPAGRRPGRFLAALAALLIGPATARGDGIDARRALATELAGAAQVLLDPQPLTVERLEAALLLVQEASALAPDDPDLARLLIEMAVLGDREEIAAEAVKRLVRLDPGDEHARLRRLAGAIDRYQTVEERVHAYERLLLDETTMRRIGPAVASRLAYDMALLERRRGDIVAYADWLARSTAMDAANPDAAALAAGYFISNVDDPYGAAELLVNLVLANPTDLAAQIDLAQRLLEAGAARGAMRIYALAVNGSEAAGFAAADSLLADLALAAWASGAVENARDVIARRQREVDEVARRLARAEHPELSPVEVARVHGHLGPSLAVVRAAFEQSVGDPTAGEAIDAALGAWEATLADADPDDPAAEPEIDPATARREMAWLALWLTDDLERIERLLAAAGGTEAMSEGLRRRFEGWLALRRGDPGAALARLGEAGEDDAPARVGVALAHLARGDGAEAGAVLAAVVESQPGTVLGVWASDRLAALVGRPPGRSETARRLEALVAGIPSSIDRLPGDPTHAVWFRLRPEKRRYRSLEPLRLTVDVRNQSSRPLAISPDGPIRPHLLLEPSLQVAGVPEIESVAPIVVDLRQRLRLDPGETLSVTVDLARTGVGQVLNAWPTTGALLRIRATLNFVASELGVIRPGLLGTEVRGTLLRIDGVRIDDAWLDETLAAATAPGGAIELRRMAELMHVVGASRSGRGGWGPLARIDEAARVQVEAYGRLDGPAQAWLLSLVPRQDADEAVLSIARRSEDRHVRMIYLLFHLAGPDDPMLDAARRGDDETLRRLAGFMADLVAGAAP